VETTVENVEMNRANEAQRVIGNSKMRKPESVAPVKMRTNRNTWMLVAFVMVLGVVRNVGARSGEYTPKAEQERNAWAESIGREQDGSPLFFGTGIFLNISETEGMNCGTALSFVRHNPEFVSRAYARGFRFISCGSVSERIVPRIQGQQDYAGILRGSGSFRRDELTLD
jgi:hypothetical protein